MKVRHLLAVIVLAALAVWFVSAIRHAREAARESLCDVQMNQLLLALQSYENANGHLPPAYVVGPDGKPWHSWRVLILPYLGYEEVYKRYRFDEPWDGPNNRRLADQILFEQYFQCPSGRDLGKTQHTNYVVVVGAGTAFPGEAASPGKPALSGTHSIGAGVVFADRINCYRAPRQLRMETLRGLLTIAGGEPATRESLTDGASPRILTED